MNHTPAQAEVDVGRLFKLIEKILIGLKKYLIRLLKSFFYLFLFIRKYIKTILIIMITGASLGLVLDNVLEKKYYSYMMVQPNYNSVYQLYSNIEYYNGLIGEKDHAGLSSIFSISEIEARSLLKFEIKPGPNNKNENLLLYDNFIKSADSITVALTSYKIFIKEQNKYIRSKHIISLYAKDKYLFKKIENGIVGGIDANTYLNEQLNKELDQFVNKEKDLNMMINRLDSINNLYQEVLITEAAKTVATSTNIDLTGNKNDKTKELELLDKKTTYLDKIRDIQQVKAKKNKFINVISGFYEKGIIEPGIFKRKIVLLPLGLVALFLIFIIIRDVNTYVNKTHEKLKKDSLLTS
jgi:hypothetical protein